MLSAAYQHKSASLRRALTLCKPRAASAQADDACDNFDVIVDHFSHISQLSAAPHAPGDVLYWVPMLTGCCVGLCASIDPTSSSDTWNPVTMTT